MSSYPNRCQHIKVNGTQCGSPALRRNRFCYFHKRHHEEQVELHLDRLKNERVKDHRRSRKITLDLPVLEDANSIQVSLMQIMRLLVASQIDGKTAGLLLYALQTASANLHHTRFNPGMHDVILDPRTVGEIPLGAYAWEDSDFEGEEEDEEDVESDGTDATANKAASKRPSGKPSNQLTGEEVRSQIRTQILKGFPTQTLERLARETGGSV
jgi:hypothetical protein